MATQLPRCLLSADVYAAVTAGYARASMRYAAAARVDDDGAVVDLRGPAPELKELLDEMVAREGQCCSQFRFVVTETEGGYRVELTIPDAPGRAATALRQAVPVFFPSATIADGAVDSRDVW